MATRDGSILDDLAHYSWKVNVILAFVIFIFMRYILPRIEFQNTFWKGIAAVAPSLAPIIFGILLVVAAVSAFNSWRKGN